LIWTFTGIQIAGKVPQGRQVIFADFLLTFYEGRIALLFTSDPFYFALKVCVEVDGPPVQLGK
jgi:hypothetical protein